MNYIYIVELMHSRSDDIELLGRFETLNNSYDYITNYSQICKFKMVMEYSHLSDDMLITNPHIKSSNERKGVIIAVNNLRNPRKFLNVRCEMNRRRKITI